MLRSEKKPQDSRNNLTQVWQNSAEDTGKKYARIGLIFTADHPGESQDTVPPMQWGHWSPDPAQASAPWLSHCRRGSAHTKNSQQTQENRWVTHSQLTQNHTKSAFETPVKADPRGIRKYSFLTVTASALGRFCWHRYPGQGSTHLSQQGLSWALGAEFLTPQGKQCLMKTCATGTFFFFKWSF